MMNIRGKLPELPPYTFGTMSLGQGQYDLAADVKVARAAMDAGIWFHTSTDYQDTYRVLRHAFDEDRAHVPQLIVKMDAKVPEMTRSVIETTLAKLKVERVDIAQMCWNEIPDIAEVHRAQGPRWQAFHELKQQGKVGSFVLEIWPNAGSCQNGVQALLNDLVDGYIFYYNLIERFVDNALFDLIEQRRAKILALRTLGGGGTVAAAGVTPSPEQRKRQELEPLFARSGCKDWLEFSVRFVLSDANVVTAISGTRRLEHLRALLDATRVRKPLDPVLVREMKLLQRKWSALPR
jgi:aryl-alcohol dehydrogenase-like predicted oxidoreductase